ncbi:MAG: PAS domain-containing protein [Phycisphaerales bacterium]|nr:PAS domain-containing protein [Hyphomonadaceae bacterium]
MAMVFTDAKEPDSPIVFANDSFLKLTGYSREEVLGKSFNALLAVGASEEAMSAIAAAFDGSSDDDPEIHYRRKDGSEFWASVFIAPVCTEDGEIDQHFVSFVDLTKFRQERARSTLLIDELNHRVKNTLSTVQSIAFQALRTKADPATVRESIESRLVALSRSHDLLTRENWEGVGLRDLLEGALKPFEVVAGRTQHFVIKGDNIRLSPKTSLALGIAFHELATNAGKYGAFANDAGSIAIDWSIKASPDGDRLILCWVESDGPPVAPPSRKGFGSQVLERGLEHELDGRVDLDFRPDGLVCTIDIPAPREV